MPARIPVLAAKDVANAYDCRQVIIVAWDGTKTHIVTYGQNLEECDQAAQGGDRIARALGWPDQLDKAVPSRVKALMKRVKELEAEIRERDRGHGQSIDAMTATAVELMTDREICEAEAAHRIQVSQKLFASRKNR